MCCCRGGRRSLRGSRQRHRGLPIAHAFMLCPRCRMTMSCPDNALRPKRLRDIAARLADRFRDARHGSSLPRQKNPCPGEERSLPPRENSLPGNDRELTASRWHDCINCFRNSQMRADSETTPCQNPCPQEFRGSRPIRPHRARANRLASFDVRKSSTHPGF